MLKDWSHIKYFPKQNYIKPEINCKKKAEKHKYIHIKQHATENLLGQWRNIDSIKEGTINT